MTTKMDDDFLADSDVGMSDEDFSDYDDDDDENVALPSSRKGSKPSGAAAGSGAKVKSAAAKTSKKAPNNNNAGGKKKGLAQRNINMIGADDDDDDDDDAFPVVVKSSGDGRQKTIEEQYQKLEQHEHVLKRPDTYIGSTSPTEDEEMFIYDAGEDAIIKKKITYTPGLFKIFDEIIVNAADNKQRDPNMDLLEVVIDAEKNLISVKNNGKGIPIVMHSKEKMYVPTMIFGHLLTGSNFDDDEKKTTGGRNGYGAKLANIFSTEFIVECVDTTNNKKFKQIFKDNMYKPQEPIVKDLTVAEKKKGDFVKITFSPDLPRFKMDHLDDDIVGLLSRRAYDIAGTMSNSHGKKLTVMLNGKKLPVKSFQDYIKQYRDLNAPIAYERVDDFWEVGVAATTEQGTPQHISFVNAICTYKGGTHVGFVADKIAKVLQDVVDKKNKGGTKISPGMIKNQLAIYVNCLVTNPTFDSQTKDALTNKAKEFAKQCQLSDKFYKQAGKGEIIDNILSFARFKQQRELGKTSGTKKLKVKGIPKLDDANKAGSAQSQKCTLILTEGDSAKSLAMSGLSVVGRDYYGVYPLRGKPLNVRDADHKKIMANEEMKNIIEILGLKIGTKYTEDNIKTLRYGHLMIMADQDHDGSHIKGLVINLIHKFWPSLLDIPSFLQCFITPIVKATKGKQSKTFFTLPEYENWRQSTGNDGKGWKVKYYKGLGTSTSAEAKDYFSNLDLHEITFDRLSLDEKKEEDVEDSNDTDDTTSQSDLMEVDELEFQPEEVKKATTKKKAAPKQDGVPGKIDSYGSDLIDMVFNKDRVSDRKSWLNKLKKDTYLNYEASQGQCTYSDFLNKEFILFSKADCERSISHVMDGFKPSQRKVLFACFKRNLKDEMKVAQLAGYIGEKTAYHHGEASLHGTIINMAQNFVGSNNVNFLTPAGQFGTRRMGGKDSASPRYIFTKLEKITRTIFHPDDDELLHYLSDDGVSIEPEYFMPVIPTVLINGSDGIGTGWSSAVPNYDPREIINNIRKLINGEEVDPMHPAYTGYNGTIEYVGEQKYDVKGRIERVDDTTLVITELPVKMSIQSMKERLDKQMNETAKGADGPDIKDFTENHTDATVHFTITATKEKIDEWEKEKGGLYKKFGLISSLSTSNMNLYDVNGRIIKYCSPEKILKTFFDQRLEFYVKRKALLVKKLRRERLILSNKARFVEEVCKGDLVVSNRKKVDLLDELQQRKYDLFDAKDASVSASEDDVDESEEEDDLSVAKLSKGYEYLLGMKIWNLTFEKVEEIRAQLEERTGELNELEATSPSNLWERDLSAIEEALTERDEEIAKAAEDEQEAKKKTTKRNASKAKKTKVATAAAKRKPAKKVSVLDSDEDSDDDFVDDMSVVVLPKKAVSQRKPVVTKATAAPAAVSKPAPKIDLTATAPKIPMAEEKAFGGDDDDDDHMNLDLMSRLLAKKQNPSKAEKIDQDRDDVSSSGSSSKRPSPKSSSDPTSKKAKKCTSAAINKKAAPAKKAARKKKKSFDDSDEEDFEDFGGNDLDSDDGIPPPPQRSGRARRGATKTTNYAAMFDGDSSIEEEDSDDDF